MFLYSYLYGCFLTRPFSLFLRNNFPIEAGSCYAKSTKPGKYKAESGVNSLPNPAYFPQVHTVNQYCVVGKAFLSWNRAKSLLFNGSMYQNYEGMSAKISVQNEFLLKQETLIIATRDSSSHIIWTLF